MSLTVGERFELAKLYMMCYCLGMIIAALWKVLDPEFVKTTWWEFLWLSIGSMAFMILFWNIPRLVARIEDTNTEQNPG